MPVAVEADETYVRARGSLQRYTNTLYKIYTTQFQNQKT